MLFSYLSKIIFTLEAVYINVMKNDLNNTSIFETLPYIIELSFQIIKNVSQKNEQRIFKDKRNNNNNSNNLKKIFFSESKQFIFRFFRFMKILLNNKKNNDHEIISVNDLIFTLDNAIIYSNHLLIQLNSLYQTSPDSIYMSEYFNCIHISNEILFFLCLNYNSLTSQTEKNQFYEKISLAFVKLLSCIEFYSNKIINIKELMFIEIVYLYLKTLESIEG